MSLLELLNLADDQEVEMPNLFTESPYMDNEEALNVLSKNKNQFNLLTLNCQSLMAKFDQLQIYMNFFTNADCPLSVVCLQETWLSAIHDVSMMNIEGYKFVYKPKSASLHGGVGFYIKDSLDFKVISTNINDDLCDSMFVQFKLETQNSQQTCSVILGNIYRPPRENSDSYNSFMNSLEQTLATFENVQHVLLVGDFNFDLLKIKQKTHVNTFLETMLSNGYVPMITQPTRIMDNSKTLIDNCFVKCPNNCPPNASAILYHNISDHQPYITCFDYKMKAKQVPQYVKLQTKSTEAVLSLRNELKGSCNPEIFKPDSMDPNACFELLYKQLQTSIRKYLPLKIKKFHKHKHKESKWITQGIIRSIQFRDKLYKRLKDTPITNDLHETLRTNLKTYNRILKQSIRNAKKQYYHTRFIKCSNDIKKTWKVIKDVTNPSKSDKEVPTHFVVDGEEISDNSSISNKFNNHFVNIGPSLANKIPQNQNVSYHRYLTSNISSVFELKHINEQQVLKIIDGLKSKSSSGIDNISNQLLKQIKHEIVPALTIIINKCLKSGIFPDKLKIAKVLPIYKKKEEYLLDNYRPISVLPSLSKVLERVMHNQLYAYFCDNDLFYPNQYGFREKHSTELAALDLLDKITCVMDANNVPLNVFLDLSRAFDTLDHNILLHKLKYYGVHEISLKLFESYLCQRKQLVEFNDVKSEYLTIQTGVPQGSILGPLLFIIYVNDLKNVCKEFTPVIYADDSALSTVLKVPNSNNSVSANILNNELNDISIWFKVNKLSVNGDKTKAMVFHSQNKKVNLPEIFIDNARIEFVKEFNYLGITLDNNLTWKPHLNSLSQKIAKTNGIMLRLKHFFPVDILKLIYNSLVLPYLNYGILAWGSACERLFKLQKRSVRTIVKGKYNAHTDPIFKSLSLLKINDILKIQEYKFIYKIENHIIPEYFKSSMFTRQNQIHQYGTRHSSNYVVPHRKHAFARHSVRNKIPAIFNESPACIKEKIYTHSLQGFSKYLKSYFITKYADNCNIPNCYICQKS